MRKAAPVIIIIMVALLSALPAAACSSYAVYTNCIQYGVNFDLGGRPELQFNLLSGKDGIRYFTLSFNADGMFRRMSGVNSEGLLATLQSVPPRGPVSRSSGTLISDILDEALYKASTVEQVREIIGNRRLTHVPGFYLHSFFADKNGHTLVVEVGEKGNFLMINKENYAVMTNFHLADFVGAPEESIVAPGSVRYHTALNEIRTYMGRMDLDRGLDILWKVAQPPLTQASYVVSPVDKQLYMALRGDFRRIWRIDLGAGTLETYRGFKSPRSMSLTEVSSSVLESWE